MTTEPMATEDGMTQRELSMQEVVRTTGTTSRTLRHYQQVGLLAPSRTGPGGLRFYDRDGLLRLQRILVLRELGLGLPEIGRVLDAQRDVATALREHVEALEREQDRLARITGSVRETLRRLERGEALMAEDMFDGFDHTAHREEVEQRWGEQAWADSDRWWRALDDSARQGFQAEFEAVLGGFADAEKRGLAPEDEEVQTLTARLHAWVAAGWGGRSPGADAFVGLGDMYVADERFSRTFTVDGRALAPYVRNAMVVHALAQLD